FCGMTELKLVQALQHTQSAWYFVLAGLTETGESWYLCPDICGDYYRNGRLFLRAAELTVNRKLLRQSTQMIYVPSPSIAFIYYLLKRLDKGTIAQCRNHYLVGCWKADRQGCLRQLMRFFDSAASQLIVKAGDTSDFVSLFDTAGTLRLSLRRRLPWSI